MGVRKAEKSTDFPRNLRMNSTASPSPKENSRHRQTVEMRKVRMTA